MMKNVLAYCRFKFYWLREQSCVKHHCRDIKEQFHVFLFFFYNGTKLKLQIISGKYLFYIAKRKNTVVLASDTLFTYK